MTGFIEGCLYFTGVWFILATLSLAIFAANRPGRGQKAAVLGLVVLTAVIAAVQIVAAGDLR